MSAVSLVSHKLGHPSSVLAQGVNRVFWWDSGQNLPLVFIAPVLSVGEPDVQYLGGVSR